ncbi:MAG TPA: 30S ribosomal protein S6 [Candidatus Omnitrophota bacterium]|nr:30S ribosomal protein S6 [Candidatus Omnitrophota bacterium]
MNKYELVYIVDAHAPQAARDEISKQVTEAASKSDVKVINSQVWLERHRMSFPIKKVWEGTYYLLNIEAPMAAVNKMQASLRLNEQILRFLAIRQENKSA